MSSQIYNSDKYNFSKISLSGGRIPYYTDLSEIKTDSSFSSPRTLYLILRLSWKLITRFIFLHVIYIFLFKKKKNLTLESFCGTPCMQKSQKLPADVWVGMCHRPGPPIALRLTCLLHTLSCDQIKEKVVLFQLFYLKAALQSFSTARYFMTEQILLSAYILFAMVNPSTFLYVGIAASDPSVSTSDNPELLEVKIDKIWKIAIRG